MEFISVDDLTTPAALNSLVNKRYHSTSPDTDPDDDTWIVANRRKKKTKKTTGSSPESISSDPSKRKIDFHDDKKSPISIKTNNETFDKKSYKEAVKQQYVVETSPNIVNKPKQSSQIDNTGSFLSSGVEGEKIGAKLHPISSKEGVPRQSPLKSQQTIYSTKKVDQDRKINKSTIVNQSKIGHDCLDDVIARAHHLSYPKMSILLKTKLKYLPETIIKK